MKVAFSFTCITKLFDQCVHCEKQQDDYAKLFFLFRFLDILEHVNSCG
jgi:hypothetical protein